MCKVCGSHSVDFLGIAIGYSETCSRKCSAINHRKNLAENIEKSSSFKKKVSENQQRIWNDRKSTGEIAPISKKISETLIRKNSLLSTEERKLKFGWMNKLSDDDFEEWKKLKMLNCGAHLWWQVASEIDKQEVYDKRNSARISIPLLEYKKEIPLSKQSYYILAGLYTADTYFKYKDKIDPNGVRGKGYHLDHKYSIIRGYYDGIPPEIIGSKFNLEILLESENLKKNSKCSITRDQLLENYYGNI